MAADTVGVRVAGISKRYSHRVKGEVWAAREVSLDVAPGEFLTLLGPSGCGKTTTLRTIAGFEVPDTGSVHIGERDVTALPANRRDIGFVFQNYALFPHLSIFDNVAYGLQVRGEPRSDIDSRVAEVLALVGLAGFEHQFSAQLSGGEQQRVALARAIVIRPRVLLFDEPLSNLDAKLRVQMRQEIRALQRRLGITTIYVTHDQEEAMAVSDRIVVMNRGRVVQQGSAEDLYRRPQSDFVARFIGRINAVAVEVLTLSDGHAEVSAFGRRWSVAAPPGLQPGSAAQLMLRPEAVQVLPAGAVGALPASLLSSSFLGEKLELLLDCAGTPLLAVRPGGGAPLAPSARGEVAVRLDTEMLMLLPGAADAT